MIELRPHNEAEPLGSHADGECAQCDVWRNVQRSATELLGEEVAGVLFLGLFDAPPIEDVESNDVCMCGDYRSAHHARMDQLHSFVLMEGAKQ